MNAGPAQNTAGTSVLTFNPSCYRQDLETFFTGGQAFPCVLSGRYVTVQKLSGSDACLNLKTVLIWGTCVAQLQSYSFVNTGCSNYATGNNDNLEGNGNVARGSKDTVVGNNECVGYVRVHISLLTSPSLPSPPKLRRGQQRRCHWKRQPCCCVCDTRESRGRQQFCEQHKWRARRLDCDRKQLSLSFSHPIRHQHVRRQRQHAFHVHRSHARRQLRVRRLCGRNVAGHRRRHQTLAVQLAGWRAIRHCHLPGRHVLRSWLEHADYCVLQPGLREICFDSLQRWVDDSAGIEYRCDRLRLSSSWLLCHRNVQRWQLQKPWSKYIFGGVHNRHCRQHAY